MAPSSVHPCRRARLPWVLALCATAAALPAPAALRGGPPSAVELEAVAVRAVESVRDQIVEIRHDLHRHPEPSGEEERTAGVVAQRLRALGLEVRTGVGGHGVVGIVRGSQPGRTVAYRADMDAMRNGAPDPAPYRSVVEGVRHICGHDVHTTIALAVAEGLAAIRDRLAGTVVVLFQPAEENATGAEAMLADGVFDHLRPDAVFGLHTAPLPVGQLATRAGVLMPGRDDVRVRIAGDGDLDAAASSAREAILGLVTVGPAQSSTPMPPEGWVAGFVGSPASEGGARTVRATLTIPDRATRARVRAELESAVARLGQGGIDASLEYGELTIAGVDNDPRVTERAIAQVERALGAGPDGQSPVLRLETLIPAFSEDFGSFQRVAPGAFFFLGVSNPETGTIGMPHTPNYVADDEAIFVGASAMLAVILDAVIPDP